MWSYKAWCSAVISCFFNSSDWCISILVVICSLGGPLSHGFLLLCFFDRGHPRFWNFYSTITVDVVRVKSYRNCLFDPVFVVTKVTIKRIHRIPCEWGKVYNGETGRPMQDRIKEHDRDIRLARTETSAVSGHAHNTRHKPLWNEVKFIDLDPFYCTRMVKEPIHIRLHPENINRDSGIEIPEAWIPTIKKHNNRRATLPLSQHLPNFPQH